MRTLNYKVRTENGFEFTTTDYTLAVKGENRILETYFTEVNEKTDKESERAEARARKVREILKNKRG